MSSAHGRPRIVNPADCSIDPPSIYDFPDPTDLRAHIFVSYVSITSILCDLCQLLTRQAVPHIAERDKIGRRLLDYVRSLPPALRLVQPNGVLRPYSLDLAQLHVHLLTSIIILYRPQSIKVPPSSAPAVVASNLNFRIFEAIQLRGHTCFLSSGFAWHLLVTAIPLLSCLSVPELRGEFGANLDVLETCFRTLASTRPAAANNLRTVQAIRRALESKDGLPPTALNANITTEASSFPPLELFASYGDEVPENYNRIATALESFSHKSLPEGHDISATLYENENVFDIDRLQPGPFAPTPGDVGVQGLQDDFPELLGSNFPEDGWMRNWINELNIFND